MITGEIVLIPFPFADFSIRKVRPAVVVCETTDRYKDLVLCAISSVMPLHLSDRDLMIAPTDGNGLRKPSVVKMDRIVTAKSSDIIARIGELHTSDLDDFKAKFCSLVSNN